MRRLAVLLTALALLAVSCSDDGGSADPPDAEPDPEVTDDGAEPTDDPTDGDDDDADVDEGPGQTLTVLGDPGRVTGGDVLVQLGGVSGEPELLFTADGEPLNGVDHGDGIYLLSGLPDGPSSLEWGSAEPVEVVNHSITGPVFSGPQQQPYYCALDRFGLTATGDDACSAETVVDWGYVNDDGEFVVLDEGDTPTDALVIRRERGTVNRGIYTIASADSDRVDDPFQPGRDLVFMFGGGCGTGHTQASGLVAGSSVYDVEALEAGYIVATNSLNVLQAHCNTVLSAETLMMTKEHIEETYGPLRLTIGRGGSGGAIQQYSIVQNYPGLLDAVHASVSFPDSATTAGGVTDCGLLLDFWSTDAGASFTDDQKLAIQGHGSIQFCNAWRTTFLQNVSPSAGCDQAVPSAEVYHPDTNPDGIRCTLQDSAKNIFGVDEDGYGRRALDNVGVQYGLRALESGVIGIDEFLTLNASIGGYDLDGAIADERSVADPEALEISYATGAVLRGDSGVNDIPIIDVDLYSDLGFDIHDRFRLFSIRERMTGDASVAADNRVIWTRGGAGLIAVVQGDDPGSISDEEPGTVPSPVETLDWLAEWALTGERPEGVADDCVLDGVRVVGDDAFDEGEPCAEAYPYHGDPRTAAGAPVANDIIKCALVPADAASYGVAFNDAQAGRLAEVFPDGVCDWTQPGVGQVPLDGVWLDFSS